MLSFLEEHVSPFAPYIGLALLVGLFAAFVTERRPPVVMAITGGVLMMMAFGFLAAARIAWCVQQFRVLIAIAAAPFQGRRAVAHRARLRKCRRWIIRRTLRKPRLAVAEIGAGTIACLRIHEQYTSGHRG